MHRLHESEADSRNIIRKIAHLILGSVFLFFVTPGNARAAPSQNARSHGSSVEALESTSDMTSAWELIAAIACCAKVDEVGAWHAPLYQGGNTVHVPAKPVNGGFFIDQFEQALGLLSCCFFNLLEPWNEDYRWLAGYAMRALILVEEGYVGVGVMFDKTNVAETRANSYTENAAGEVVGRTFDGDNLNKIELSNKEWFKKQVGPPVYRFMFPQARTRQI